MKNKLKLSPKAKTTVGVKRTLVFASIGAGIFVMIFTGAFFYLNMGNSEKALAGNPAETIKATGGLWHDETTWTVAGKPRLPVSGDTIRIPAGVVLTISNKNVSLSNVSLFVFGTLKFDKAHLALDGISEIIFYPGSSAEAEGAIGHNHIKIGHAHLKTPEINNLQTPIYFDRNSTIAGKEIPLNKLSPILLPIVLDYFTAAVSPSNSVLVEWGTVSEINNDFFTLERSSDGKTFETIATIEGAGNSLQKLQYSFEDHKSTVGMNYYRLKQTDYNGDFEYFKIVGVNNILGASQGMIASHKGALIISEVYPNPFKNELNLSFEAETDGNVEIMIQDARGEIVHKERIPFFYGNNEFKHTKGDKLKAGIYYLSLWNHGKKINTQRLIKM